MSEVAPVSRFLERGPSVGEGLWFCVLVRAFDVPVFKDLPETGEYAPLTEWAI